MPRQQEPAGAPEQLEQTEPTRRGAFAATLEAADGDPAAAAAAFDVVRVRNYDHRRRHDVAVALDSPDGERVLSDRLSLPPGDAGGSRAWLPAGEYDLHVRVDGVERARATCRLSRSPADTAVVELGNGAVSVTPGADGRASSG